jgi:Protein of unknown function (DUF3352)
MRRTFFGALLAAAATVALAACGSSSSSAANPVTTELSYFPSNSPFILSVQTDPNSAAVKGAEQLLARFPLATFGKTALMSKLDQLGLDYQSDIRPLFGNPVMVGANGATLTGAQSNNYLIVWVTKDSSKLAGLMKKVYPSAQSTSHDGAKVYSSGGPAAAVDDATLVFGPSTAAVNQALDRHAQKSGFTQSNYSRLSSGLPQNSLIQTFGDLTTVLGQPTAAKARRVPWVAAFRGYGASVSATSTGLTFSYHLDTTGATLTPAQVPFASGTATPALAGLLPVVAGIQNPSHIVQWVESVERVTSPVAYTKFQAREAAVRKKTGADASSLIGLLTGNLIVSSDLRTTMARAQVTDANKASSTLAQLVTAPKLVFSHATSVSKLGGGFYGINQPSGTVTLGVVGNQIVVGKATPARLRAFAASPTTPATGAQGSVAFRVGLATILRVAIKQSPPQVARSILNQLGDITGWVSATTKGINGSATIAVR